MRWLWISLSYATFALAVKDGVVIEAAPIAKWAIGKPEDDVATYYKRKKAMIRDLPVVRGSC